MRPLCPPPPPAVAGAQGGRSLTIHTACCSVIVVPGNLIPHIARLCGSWSSNPDAHLCQLDLPARHITLTGKPKRAYRTKLKRTALGVYRGMQPSPLSDRFLTITSTKMQPELDFGLLVEVPSPLILRSWCDLRDFMVRRAPFFARLNSSSEGTCWTCWTCWSPGCPPPWGSTRKGICAVLLAQKNSGRFRATAHQGGPWGPLV